MSQSGEITRLLKELEDRGPGHSTVLERLIPLVYSQLKELARKNRYRWRGAPQHGTTSLVHEAYSKLARGSRTYTNRGEFFAVASKAMRSILIDNARWNSRKKRGGEADPTPLDRVELVSAERSDELLALDEALTRLADEHPGLAEVVESKVFGGLTNAEVGETIGVSKATVKRRWTVAKAILYRELRPQKEAS